MTTIAEAYKAQMNYALGKTSVSPPPKPPGTSQRLDKAIIDAIFRESRTGQWSRKGLAEHLGVYESTIKKYAAPDRRWRGKTKENKNAGR